MTTLKDATSSLKDIVEMVQGIRKRATASLTKYTKDAHIFGRVYIEDSIASDDVALPLMGMLNQMYVSYILTALHLDQQIVGGRTVREVIGLVASQEAVDAGKIIEQYFGKGSLDKPIASLEDSIVKSEDDSQRLVCGRLIELDMMGLYTVYEGEDNITVTDNTSTKDDRSSTLQHKNGGDDAGTSVSATTTSDTGKTKSSKIKASAHLQPFKAYVYVQLIPYILDSTTSENFFLFNFVPGFIRRWRAVRAGEIKFFRDFLFAKDLIERQRQGLKKDRTGVLLDMMLRQKNALFKWAMQLVGIRPENHNAASSMCVVSKQSFDAACANARVNFSSAGDRQRFFTKTFSMLLLVVDPMYGSVDMYINGVNAVGKYTFEMINRVGSKSRDSFDLKQIMQALNQGMTPKF